MLAETPEAQDLIALLDALVSTGARPLARSRAAQPAVRRHRSSTCSRSRAARAAGDRDWWRALRELAAPSAALDARANLLRALARSGRRDCRRTTCSIASSTKATSRARYAAAVPAEQRALALDAIDAVLAQSLLLDGGRYATPYALRARAEAAGREGALPVRADAVRLLTVHGAKGLEADTVFVDGRRSGAPAARDDDAARRLAGRGRPADALRLRLQREPLPALAARPARRRDAARASARS